MHSCDHEDSNPSKTVEKDDIDALRNQLDYFVKLSQAQKEQIKNYKDLQQRSHRLIQTLIKRTTQKQSWKKNP